MKIRRIIGAATVVTSAALMCTAAHAATYTIGSASVAQGNSVTLDVKVSPDGSASSMQLNGYAMNISYDATALKPVEVTAKDATGAALYAENKLGSGVIVSEPTENGANSKLSLAWANASAQTVAKDTVIAQVTFKALDDAALKTYDLDIDVIDTAISEKSLDAGKNGGTGTITVTASASESTDCTAKGATVSFADNICLNYYIDVPDALLKDSGAYAEFTRNGKTEKMLVSKATKSTFNGAAAYRFTYQVVAKEANDDVNLKIYNGKGEAVKLLTSSSDLTATGLNLSLSRYAASVNKSSSNSAEMKALANAALDYSHAAQIYFDYNASDASVSSNVTSISYSDFADYRASADGTAPAGLAYNDMTAMFESDNSIRVWYKITDSSKSIGNYTATVDGVKQNFTQVGDRYYITATGISAKELDTVHTFTVTDGTNVYTIKASALSYARALAQTSKPENSQNLGKALYLYNKTADAFFK